MEDDELAAIRARRLAEMQMGAAGRGAAPMGLPGMGAGPDMAQKAQQQQQAEEARQSILAQILTPEARERLARVALVRESQARQVEDVVIRAARAGQLTDRVDERRVIQILEQLSEQQHSTKITINRRGRLDDDDDDF